MVSGFSGPFVGAFVFGGSVVSCKSLYEKEMEIFNGWFAYEDES